MFKTWSLWRSVMCFDMSVSQIDHNHVCAIGITNIKLLLLDQNDPLLVIRTLPA